MTDFDGIRKQMHHKEAVQGYGATTRARSETGRQKEFKCRTML
jgi:hypothetical protein